ncbi:DUF6495 family protein [Lutibacter maritimus]|uniref:Histidyl-tRNA synthetase n=1 Tax=Lutibacter maritimus TaxID=593133 RepID=A0A1I6P3F9_9FLAO|nr:DUF6495 family protein [Lutibacter maritimus]SFS34743.1 hypothetical protein SAMN04488006_0861 [Lutibacter maritimus]
MKYRLLTKEQLQELHEEFSKFLATQQIDSEEWKTIKKEKPSMADEELAVFSDVVWEDVLTKTSFLEHISENHMNLFKCDATKIFRIYIKLNDSSKSFLNNDDFNWFINNPLDNSIEYFKASKKYDLERNLELFKLIELGSVISKGELYTSISQLID